MLRLPNTDAVTLGLAAVRFRAPHDEVALIG